MEKKSEVDREQLNGLSSVVIGAAVTVHKEMGPGILEAVYQLCMVKELQSRKVMVAQCVPVPLFYKGEALDKDYIIDLLVESEIIIELKAVEGILPVHEAQILSYPQTRE